jgi:methyl-accepting chemotaxis protein
VAKSHQVAEQLTVLLNSQAQNAEEATQTALASETAHGGAEVVQEAMASMERLAERVRSSALSISDLGEHGPDQHDSGGDQRYRETQLLAMNATIEAAHAGDFGQGFTVVANEVRELARRISDATKEIDRMVGSIQVNTDEVVVSMEESSQEADERARLAAESGNAIREISEAVFQVNELVGQLSASIAEQARTSSSLMQTADQAE